MTRARFRRSPPVVNIKEASEAVTAEQLQEIMAVVAEVHAMSESIWATLDHDAYQDMLAAVRSGELPLNRSGEFRERTARRWALEGIVEYGLAGGMSAGHLDYLVANVLGLDTIAQMRLGQYPERAVIDDLRGRVALIVQLGSPEPEAAVD